MLKNPLGQKPASRRRVLGLITAFAALPILQACASPPAAPTPGSAPAATSPPASAATTAASSTPAQSKPANGAPVTIRVQDRAAPKYVKFMEAWVNEYHQKQSAIRIEYEPRPGDTEWIPKLTAAIAAGAAPDVVAMCCEWLRLFQQKGQFLPLDNYIKSAMSADDIADFWQSQYKGMNYGGKQLGIPYYLNVNVMYYNIDLLTAAGLQPPKDAWTHDDFLDYAQKLTAKSGDSVDRWGIALDLSLAGFMRRAVSFVWARGGQIDDETTTTKFTFTKPETVAGFQWIHDLAYKQRVASAKAADLGGLATDASFWATKSSLLFEGIHIFENLPDGVKFKWDVVRPPTGPTGMGQRTGMDSFTILSGSKQPDQAWSVVHDLTSVDTMRTRVNSIGFLGSRKSIFNDWVAHFPGKNVKSLIDSIDKAQPDPYSQWNRSGDVVNTLKGTFEQLFLLNKLSVPDALNKMQSDVEKLYKG